jgi:hypothetical protein
MQEVTPVSASLFQDQYMISPKAVPAATNTQFCDSQKTWAEYKIERELEVSSVTDNENALRIALVKVTRTGEVLLHHTPLCIVRLILTMYRYLDKCIVSRHSNADALLSVHLIFEAAEPWC